MASPFSVLMSVYSAETPQNLQACLDSLAAQTLPADQIVVVHDGPIGAALETVLEGCTNLPLQQVRLARNVGLGAALNQGLTACAHDLVVRMDTDDICLPDRFIQQVTLMDNNPDIALSSGHVEEFGLPDETAPRLRRVPIGNDAIGNWIKRRNPMNHPAVIMRKSVVESVGCYPAQRYAQDYQLWINMFAAGYKLANLDAVLVRFRIAPNFYRKRGGSKYVGYEYQLQRNLWRKGVIGPLGFASNLITRSAVRVMPDAVRGAVYTLLRRRA